MKLHASKLHLAITEAYLHYHTSPLQMHIILYDTLLPSAGVNHITAVLITATGFGH